MADGCVEVGDWIQTFTGRAFWPFDPRPEDLDILDIAHALSNLCRYTGHVRTFYCVAHHADLVSRHCPPDDALEGLMHDASEAYLVDVPRPVKRRMATYRAAEERLEAVIATRFGLRWPWPPSVKAVDNQLLATERRDLMRPPPMPWRPEEQLEPLEEKIVPWPAEEAELRFLARFYALTDGRKR